MTQAPEATELQTSSFNFMADVFSQRVRQLLMDEQDQKAFQELPSDMQLESYVVGILTGLMSAQLQLVPREHHQTVIDNTLHYVPIAAEAALNALDREARGAKSQ